MCHLILLMPIIGLVVFWIWPFSVAMPVYVVILTVSAVVYAAILKSMRNPVTTGSEGMLGALVNVIDMSGHRGRVAVRGSIWRAVSDDALQPGDKARVTEVHGLTLTVKKEERPPSSRS